jgi:SWI/SNF-related matrix-associated actin-dependent regulator 1 of chromatin subfamily A
VNATLFPYQQAGAQWLTTKRFALLADEPGLGKSAQAITAAYTCGAQRILVVTPATGRENWAREFASWSTRQTPVSLLEDTRVSIISRPELRAVCSYNYLTENADSFGALLNIDWDLVIADESHFAMNPYARRTQALYGSLSHCTRRFWSLSGTPSPSHAAQLWPMLYTFGATTLEYEDFVQRYCTSSWFNGERRPTGTADPESIKWMLAPLMLRRTAEEVFPELPPILWHDHVVEATPLTDAQLEFFTGTPAGTAERLRREIAEQRRVMEALWTRNTNEVVQGWLEQLFDQCSTLRKWIGASKVAGVAQLVKEEIDAGAYKKIVVWAYHTSVIETLADMLREQGVVVVYGNTPAKWRQKAVDSFNNDPAVKVFVGQYVAAGTVINLPAAHEEIFLEYSWRPDENYQAAKRCHRAASGVQRPVRVRFAVLPGGLDEVILRVVRRKTRELAEIYRPTVVDPLS